MLITEAHIDELNRRIAYGPYQGHYVDGIDQNWMLFGMDSAQKAYLIMMDTIQEAFGTMTYPTHPGGDHFEKLAENLNKTGYEAVSNFWIVFKKNSVSFELTGDQNFPIKMSQTINKQQARGFFDRFNTSDYSMNRVTPKKLAKGIDKAESGKTFENDINKMNKYLKQYAVRRACKFLMYEATGEGYGIRYALDDLDLDVIVNKLRIDGKLPVCTTELREISQKLVDRGVKNVQLDVCSFYHSINYYANAIEAYHLAQPSRFRTAQDGHMVNDATNGFDNM
jgi:hypothetical protein